ncbi:MAG: ribosomal protein S18 acetylase RimI-like enzyme [Rickettsiales bacterium]|jgi:ribosomal protein S18 acetylase RimI-like enzyme
MNRLERIGQVFVKEYDGIKFLNFSKWDEKLLELFNLLEQSCFNSELIYTKNELMERMKFPEFEVLILKDNQEQPIAGVLIYLDQKDGYLYIDTLAVAKRGLGFGQYILLELIKYAKKEGLRGICLDTEELNHFGQNLVKYYQKFGFNKDGSNLKTGNIHLTLKFNTD